MTKSFIRITSTVLIIAFATVAAMAKGFCENNYNNNKGYNAQDLREVTIGATGRLDVDGRKNGGITVIGAERNDVLVRACVRSWADSQAEADNLVQTTRIETSPAVRAVSDGKEHNASVSFEIHVPRATSLKLEAHNGGIKVYDVNGSMDLATVNGGISLGKVSGDVKGRTTNGGIKVGLDGFGWTGGGLDVETVNGGIKIDIPANFAANIETGTVNGGFKSDFPELQIPEKEGKTGSYSRNKKVNATLNGGGATIRAVTTNGGVKIMRAGGN